MSVTSVDEGLALPTRLSLRALRADALHRLLLSKRGWCPTADEIATLAVLASWNRRVVDLAIADLVATGALIADPRGRLRMSAAVDGVSLVELRPGDETDDYTVVAAPIRERDGGVRVRVRCFDEPWRDTFVTGDPDDDVLVIERCRR